MSKYDECRDDFRRARERNDAKKVEDASRRQSAHDWYREQVEKGVTLPTLEEAHLAGQGCEEKRMADEIAALRKKYDGRAAFFGQAQADFMLAESAYKDEIAALREAVRCCYDEGKLTREVEDAIDRARGRG